MELVRVGYGHGERRVPLQGPSLATEALGRLDHSGSVGPTCWDRLASSLKAGHSGRLRPSVQVLACSAQGRTTRRVKGEDVCPRFGKWARLPPGVSGGTCGESLMFPA